MIEAAILVIFLVYLFLKDREDKKREEEYFKVLDNGLRNTLDQVESNTEKFYETVSQMQIKHFENLEKHTDKLLKNLLIRPEPFKEEKIINEIEKEEVREDDMEDNRIPIIPGLKVQFEGEETIHDLDIQT